jgi:hypothetical protein
MSDTVLCPLCEQITAINPASGRIASHTYPAYDRITGRRFDFFCHGTAMRADKARQRIEHTGACRIAAEAFAVTSEQVCDGQCVLDLPVIRRDEHGSPSGDDR